MQLFLRASAPPRQILRTLPHLENAYHTPARISLKFGPRGFPVLTRYTPRSALTVKYIEGGKKVAVNRNPGPVSTKFAQYCRCTSRVRLAFQKSCARKPSEPK